MVARTQTSAAGVLALLSEDDALLQEHALKALVPLVPQFWAEISEQIDLIEALYESSSLPKQARDSAALLASKVYYYLGEYEEALSFALNAGPAFDAEARSAQVEEYVEIVTSNAIDRYVKLRVEEAKIDVSLQTIVDGIFKRCIEDGEHRHAIGIALESHRLDIIRHLYDLTSDIALLSYAMQSVLDTGFSLSYRDEVLKFLLPLFPTTSRSTHLHTLTRLLVTLSVPTLTVSMLNSLVEQDHLLAYQLAFDLVEGGAQDFLESVRNELPATSEDYQEAYDKLRLILTGQESVRLYADFLRKNNKVDLLILKSTKEALDSRSSVYHTALTLQNAFMHSGTASDIFLRENLEWLGKASNWSKFSATAALGVIHKGNFENGMTILGPYLPGAEGNPGSLPGSGYSEGGALFALGLINAGCGSGGDVEGFLIDKLKPDSGEVVQHGAALGLGVAGLGGRNSRAYDELSTVLFTDSAVAGEASGYAMGLIMLGTGDQKATTEMLQYAKETQHEKIIRGLAIGVAFLYYGRQEEANEKIDELFAQKDPILRYGGVYTLALAYAGTANNNAVRKLLHVAVSDTSDDVRRAAVTSLAFLLFKNPSQVPRIVQLLSESYNPHVRCGATLALGIACAGTGSQDAIDILDPMTKDPVDFVRQGAFIALGMILVQQSEASAPSMASTRAMYTKIIADKHEDPMARLGSALGQGLIDAGGRNVSISLQSRAGTKNTSAIVGMVLFCQFWYWYPLANCACLAFEPTGIIGLNEDLKVPDFEFVSNAVPSLFAYPPTTKPPQKETVTKVATAVLSTTAKAKAREKTKEKEKAVANGDAMDTDEKPLKTLEDNKEDVAMSEESTSPKHGDISPISGSLSGPVEPTPVPAKSRKAEPSSERLTNFSRVTPAQLAHITFPPDGRYHPVRPVSTVSRSSPSLKTFKSASARASLYSERHAGGGAIVMLIDRDPMEPAELLDLPRQQPPPLVDEPMLDHATVVPSSAAPSAPGIAIEDGPEADPPAPFEYPFDNDT